MFRNMFKYLFSSFDEKLDFEGFEFRYEQLWLVKFVGFVKNLFYVYNAK